MSIHPVMQRLADKLRRTDLPEFVPGDTVRVQVKIKEGDKERLQAFEGIVIALKNGAQGSFTVRKMSFGQGVERIFPFNSKVVDRWRRCGPHGCGVPSCLPARPAWQGSSPERSGTQIAFRNNRKHAPVASLQGRCFVGSFSPFFCRELWEMRS